MPLPTHFVVEPDEPVLTITRTYAAPRALVFKAWTEPEHLKRWWAPKGFTVPFCTVDLRPGGVWRYCMRGPDGQDYWGQAVYHEIVPPQRLVYTDAFSDAEGNTIPPESQITVTFTEDAGKTLLTSRTVFASFADRTTVIEMGVEEGISQTLDHLEELLAHI